MPERDELAQLANHRGDAGFPEGWPHSNAAGISDPAGQDGGFTDECIRLMRDPWAPVSEQALRNYVFGDEIAAFNDTPPTAADKLGTE